jgi:predicted dehydrogenase
MLWALPDFSQTYINNMTSSNRRHFLGTSVGAAGLLSMPLLSRAAGANDTIRVAVIGVNGRGTSHISSLKGIDGVQIVALCDCDQLVLDRRVKELAEKTGSPVKGYKDYRELLADKEIDAVTIATPNHNHVLIAMSAIAAGKHVYVEKPICHNPIEGRKLVEAAAKRPAQIVVHGMQRRSDKGWAQAMDFVKAGSIGKVTLSRGINYKMRASIGKVAAAINSKDGIIAGEFRDTGGKPQKVDVDYRLWSAPRPELPLSREQFHYDWHWQWAYGNGDLGNQGPHQLDVARWALGNPTELPKKVMSFGGRWGYTDDGQTANNQMAFFNYEPVPMLFDNRGLPKDGLKFKKGWEPVKNGIRIGNFIHCEGGYVAENKAFDNEGKKLASFDHREGPEHMPNFIKSIREGKLVNENLHISHGYHAASLAHLANYSFRLGSKMNSAAIKERLATDKEGLATFEDFIANLKANMIDIDADQATVGPWLAFDPASERFTGEFAAEANKMMEEEYAPGFELPVI